ncbi:Component of a membrane-bound complex containing the Tor2p kinase [Coemansia guatemalensis]|uniref:Component of a membrane-bound complex containing the Tor2p kinase n=1 Tax=Coemansia guatemalensis TaxID=2761395 RepID=A0A9W8HV50_9FUNG|nr:Component of a membrane-bound complex containing the Tor2p kinase [Coemansia guatemalensis]
MSLVTDPAFLVYQLRVSFLRTNDPTGARVLTFDDLSVPHAGWGEQRGRQGSAASAMTPTGRRKTSASEIRQQVAQNATANAYIMACGHYPETEVAGSPEIEVSEGYQCSRAAAAGTGATGRSGAAGRKKRTNRNAKIAPTGAGGEQVVGLGVEPGQAEMMLDAAARRGLAAEDTGDAGSQSDSAQVGAGATQHWEPEPMPPRRSLDTIRQPEQTGSASATAVVRGRNAGHTYSNSVATIRLQRPHELLSRGSSRDAVALGIDFDVKSIFEGEEDAERSSGDGAPDKSQAGAQNGTQGTSQFNAGVLGKTGAPGSAQDTNHAARDERRLGVNPRHAGRGSHGRKKSGRRNDMSFRIPLGSLREERGGSALLKRSATLPTKRAGGSGYGAAGGAHGQTSKWAGAYAGAGRRAGNQASGWVGGAPETSWDHSSGDDADDVTPLSRRTGTQTWYGPRGGIRPISMFPPAPIPPVPLMFGADDSDDDIDLEGDDGSSRTPAALGPGLRPRAGSRKGSAGVGGAGTGLAGATPAGTKYGHLAQGAAAALSGATYVHLAQDVTARPRGSSDPEGRSAQRSSRVQSGSSWHAADSGTSRPPSNSAGATSSRNSSIAQPALDSPRRGIRTTLGRPPSGSEPPAVRDAAAAYVPRPAPAVSGLAALLATRVDVRANAFSEEFGAVGAASGDNSAVELNVFVQGATERSAARTVRVRGTATVEQAIGYVLHQHVDDGGAPTLAGDELDVVAWALRIVMDGEVDDDFPALDRSRPMANFAFDEFALCLAPPDHVRANEAARVRQGRPPRMARPASPVSAPPAPPAAPRTRELHCTVVPRVEASAVVLQPSRIAIASTAGIFVGAAPPTVAPPQSPPLSPPPDAAPLLSHAPQRLLRIRVPGESAALRATTVEADAGATMRTVLALVCRKKQFAEDEYVLGLFETAGFVVCSSDMRVADVPHDAELLLHRVGSALPSRHAPDLAPIYGRQQPPAAADAAARLATTYHSFRVIRRVQMFSRHERTLVVDGATVTLMPSELRSDSAKSHTFHIANVVCKRNQKSPKKIRLFVSRRGNAADKSFDLEAITEEDAASICSILLRLRDQHSSFSAM